MQRSLATLILLVAICSTMPAATQSAGILYDNGPVCPGYCHSQVGTIPSETFDIRGVHLSGGEDQSSAPEPGSSMIWGPVLIGLAVSLRRIAV